MSYDRAPKRSTAGRSVSAAVATLLASAVVACGGGGSVTPSPGSSRSPGAATATPSSPSPSVDAHLLSVLQESWAGYKQGFVGTDGRVTDPTRGVTTSEGQSYALLRAVWMGDRSAFDTVWHWTEANLQVRGDGLFAYLWSGGGVQDHNSATDADSDIALSLLFAAHRFGDKRYHSAALGVLGGMWRHDVTSVNGMNVLTAGNWAAAQQSPGPVINPSYLAPYAYRIFAREDGAHPWTSLIDSTYTLLDRCSAATLDGTTSAGLPPNWCGHLFGRHPRARR